MRRLSLTALGALAAAALAAALLAGPGGAQQPTRFFFMDQFSAVPNASGYIQVGLEGDGLMSCDGAWPISGPNMVAQAITRQPTPGTYLIRVLNNKGFVIVGTTVRLTCTIDVTFIEPPPNAGQVRPSLRVTTPSAAQVAALS